MLEKSCSKLRQNCSYWICQSAIFRRFNFRPLAYAYLSFWILVVKRLDRSQVLQLSDCIEPMYHGSDDSHAVLKPLKPPKITSTGAVVRPN